MFLYYLLIILLIYLLIVFIGIRLVVPYYGFRDLEISKSIPKYFLDDIRKINSIATSDTDFLRRSCDYITSKYYGSRFGFLFTTKYAFGDIFKKKDGLLPCTIMNQLLRTVLVKSGRFTNSEVKTQVVFLNFFIHQYLKIKVDGKWISVDPTYNAIGVPFGKRAIGFV